MIENFRNVDILNAKTTDRAQDWLIARDKIFEQMLRDIGIRLYNPKKAQVTESELESNDQLLLISTDDMLKSRQEGIERVNDMFGLDISVKLNDKFDISKVVNNNYMEVQTNENEQFRTF